MVEDRVGPTRRGLFSLVVLAGLALALIICYYMSGNELIGYCPVCSSVVVKQLESAARKVTFEIRCPKCYNTLEVNLKINIVIIKK